ncbi:hypothetical protein DFAR_2590010 [Desulfarculales bacterium]
MTHHPLHQPCPKVRSAWHQNPGPGPQALMTLGEHAHLILNRWISNHSNACLEGLNGIFQAPRARARGYRNVFNFMTMIYFIAASTGEGCGVSQLSGDTHTCGASGPTAVGAHGKGRLGRHPPGWSPRTAPLLEVPVSPGRVWLVRASPPPTRNRAMGTLMPFEHLQHYA